MSFSGDTYISFGSTSSVYIGVIDLLGTLFAVSGAHYDAVVVILLLYTLAIKKSLSVFTS